MTERRQRVRRDVDRQMNLVYASVIQRLAEMELMILKLQNENALLRIERDKRHSKTLGGVA